MKSTARVLTAALLVLVGGCAGTDWIDRTLVTVDVTGVWSGRAYIAHATTDVLIDVRLVLEQDGPKVKGSITPSGSIPWRVSDRPPTEGRVDGTVAGDVFAFREANGHISGHLTVNGDEMSGEIVEQVAYYVVLRRAR